MVMTQTAVSNECALLVEMRKHKGSYKCMCSGYSPISGSGWQFHHIMPALASPLCTSCFINGTDSASLQSGLLANTSLWRLAKCSIQSTNILGHLLFSDNKGLSNLPLLVQETVLKPVCMGDSLNGKRIQSKEKVTLSST